MDGLGVSSIKHEALFCGMFRATDFILFAQAVAARSITRSNSGRFVSEENAVLLVRVARRNRSVGRGAIKTAVHLHFTVPAQ
jgi:hypothetical protein